MKHKPLATINMTQASGVKAGWARFRSFKVVFNQNLVNRALEKLKIEKEK